VTRLWTHVVDEHFSSCIYPMVCPHPSCIVKLANEPALRLHFVDDHCFSPSWPGRNRRSSGCPNDEPALTDFDPGDQVVILSQSHERDPRNTRLEWIPPNCFQASATMTEQATLRSKKKSRCADRTICPSLLSSVQHCSQDLSAHFDRGRANVSDQANVRVAQDHDNAY
jgi:hypothetical protein